MPGAPIRLGPFTGGIANRADPTTINDDQVVQAINFLYESDGTLTARPPIWQAYDVTAFSNVTRLFLLGYETLYAADGDVSDVLFARSNGVTWYFKEGVWTFLNSLEYRAVCAYGTQQNKVYFPNIPNGTGATAGGWWDLNPLRIVQGIYSMPKGDNIIVHKDRLWISGDPAYPSRLYYSATGPTGVEADWDQASLTNPAGFVDINPGDGSVICHIESYKDTIVIFKNDSTWVLNYQSTISHGQLTNISKNIGTYDVNSVTSYKDTLFTFHNGNVYAFEGTGFTQLNLDTQLVADVNFGSVYSEPIILSIYGDNMICRIYDRIYVYSFYTGAWTEWSSTVPIGKVVQVPVAVGSEIKEFFTTSEKINDTKVYKIKSEVDTTHTESFTCTLVTKIYDFGADYKYKRMFWWAVNAISGLNISGIASPAIPYARSIWSDGAAFTWGSFATHPWMFPFGSLIEVTTSNIGDTAGPIREIYKLLQGLRFRQIYFTVIMPSDGSVANGPQQIFSISPMVAVKETVTKQVS